jgi:hypothetical protein
MEKDYSIALKFVQELPSEPEGTTGEILPCLLIPGRELVMLKAENIPINGVEAEESDDSRVFQTDREIRGKGNSRSGKDLASLDGRELTMWDGAEDGGPGDMVLDEARNDGGVGEWDQFAVNEKQFGVKSTYREDLYTTRLDYTKISKAQQEAAERIAKEIESGGQAYQEEDAIGGDEEAIHSAVLGTGGYEGVSNTHGSHGGRGKGKGKNDWEEREIRNRANHEAFDQAQYNDRHGGANGEPKEGEGGEITQGTTLLAPWTKSINALNLESTIAVPRKERRPLPNLAPKAAQVRLTPMPPPPKTPKVEKEPVPVSTLNPAAKAFQPGKAGVLHLAVSPGGSLSGTVQNEHERGNFMGGGLQPPQRGMQGGRGGNASAKMKRSFSPKQLSDKRSMQDVCKELVDKVGNDASAEDGTSWPEATGVPVQNIFGQPTITQDQLNQWLLRHANRTQGGNAPPAHHQQYGQPMYMATVPNFPPQNFQQNFHNMQGMQGMPMQGEHGPDPHAQQMGTTTRGPA